MGRQTQALLLQLDAACRAADDLAAATAEAFAQHPDAAILSSFPGIGPLTGARVLGEIGDDRTRFRDARGLKSYAGSAPITVASGKSLVVHHRKVKNQRLAAAGYVWIFGALPVPAGQAALRPPPRGRGQARRGDAQPVQPVPRLPLPLPADRPALRPRQGLPEHPGTDDHSSCGLTVRKIGCLWMSRGRGRTLPIILKALKQDRRANAGREGTTRAHRSSWSCRRAMTHRRVDGWSSLIDEIVREGARRMLAEALQAEVDAYIAQFADERDEHGRRLVVRNGSHQPREVLTAAGAVEVVAPRVNDRRIDPDTGERRRFSSAILPPWCRKTPKITEVLPLLYLHGLSTGDFVPALGQFLGSSAGLSAPVITKLTETWKAEQRAFAARDLSGVDYVYLWADGIHVNIRLEEHKLCLLVMIGVRADGRKELVALADGYRESAESWADLLRDCARRGMRAPVLAVGDGALGFWGALREVFPATRPCRPCGRRVRRGPPTVRRGLFEAARPTSGRTSGSRAQWRAPATRARRTSPGRGRAGASRARHGWPR